MRLVRRIICWWNGHKWPYHVYHIPIYAHCERCGKTYVEAVADGDEERWIR